MTTTDRHIGPCCGCSTGVLCETCWQTTWHNDHCDNCGAGQTPDHWEPPGTLAHDMQRLAAAWEDASRAARAPFERFASALNQRLSR